MNMRKLLIGVALLLVLPIIIDAQTTKKLAWDQPAVNLIGAQSNAYTIYDGVTAIATTGVTCTGAASPFTCTANIPTLSPGVHNISMSATSQQGIESLKSSPLGLTYPDIPVNLRIQ